MRQIRNFLEIFLTSVRRLFTYKGTAIAALIGQTIAISLILSISIYSDGIYYQTFLENVAKTRENSENQVSLENPTFAFLFHYFGGWHGSKDWDELSDLDSYFVNKGLNTIGLPVIDLVRLFSSDSFHLFPVDDSDSVNRLSLSRISFGTMNGFEENVTLVRGRMPVPQEYNDDQPIEALINENMAEKAGLEVGEAYIAYVDVPNVSGQREITKIPVTITGIWRADRPGDDYWIFSPSRYASTLFVPEATFFNNLTARIPALVYNAYWYLIMDAGYVHADEVDSLLWRVSGLERGANEIQENLWLSISPIGALEQYADEARILRVLLYAFSIPVIGLIVAYVGMVTRLSVDQRRGEIAVMRSRGGTRGLMLALTALEGISIGIVALGLSLPLATRITQSIGRTSGFLDFRNPADLRTGLSSGAWQIGIFCVVIYLGMLLLSTYRTTSDTILHYKLEKGRTRQPPIWQRIWLDLILLIPAAYGTYLLRQQGSLVLLGGENPADPFENPLLFLVPSLGILALSLFSLRLIRPIMILLDRIGSLTTWVSLTMAARNISRSPGNYYTPMLILTLTMSLFTYTASLAATLDQAMIDRSFYQVGAEARFFDPGDSTVADGKTWWDFFPVGEYAQSPNIANAARLGRYAAHTFVGRLESRCIFFGIDRHDFPLVTYWRDDFSQISLGELMNRLADDPANILVSRDFLKANGLLIGDHVDMTVKTYDQFNDLTLKIVGSFDLFPGWYPEQGHLFVGNLSHLFETAGGPVPYYVILDIEENGNPAQLDPGQLRALDKRVRPVDWEVPFSYIEEARSAPERQGFLGFLFLGFSAAVLLTMLAFLLHLIFSFRMRSVELGVLRAAGLSMGQMVTNLIWEFVFLISFGVSFGSLLGYLASVLYIPFMQVGAETPELIPPFRVLIPWGTISQIYWLFIGIFVFSLIVSIFMLRRMKIFQAIKLGETV